jgi:hypothetical protein
MVSLEHASARLISAMQSGYGRSRNIRGDSCLQRTGASVCSTQHTREETCETSVNTEANE